MKFETIEIEDVGAVRIVRLAVPEALNAMSVQMCEDLIAAIDALGPEVRAMLMIGKGKAFCSGANLGKIDMMAGGEKLDFGQMLEDQVNPLMMRLRDLDIPWISAVRGPAAGAGCALALAADLIVASETAYFMQAFVRIGLVPDAGSTWMLPRAVGRARAMEMMLLGERVSAAQALDWGLINRVVADDALEAAALDIAQRLAAGPRSVAMLRQQVWRALDTSWGEALAAERIAQRDAGFTDDAQEGIAAFLAKRPAVFQGR
ncbi:enoyl-CoA hydratase-related protein [Sphingomonas crocodyli]|uniref:2-(1,2-epoxy-1,2-dihydrophenyl)acetyl-CoA isomerase n=1 Tax=Sphingomonas crocodyli TaxID=1979270 RepID=A0A437M932_9SPHN|nr:enoyl-CoA hydratase-related protein [Sphingomonas crocodyli]RVT94218.1 2-(1,2-epoxy-1,2-dihydrophenyl)acetyl-CoA isomerase [Sphingomonas crocodyli]